MTRSYMAATLVLAAALAGMKESKAEVSPGAQPGTAPTTLLSTLTEKDGVSLEFGAVKAATEKRAFVLRCVDPDIMLWWITQGRAPMPDAVKNSLSAGLRGDPLAGFQPEAARLPAGITKLETSKAQRRFNAYGTPQALDELQRTLEVLDVPLQQAEFEVQFLSADDKDLQPLHLWPAINFKGHKGIPPSEFVFGLLPRATSQKLRGLMTRNRVRVFQSPRFTAVSGLTSSLMSATTFPFPLVGTLPQDKLAPGESYARLAYLESRIGVTLHPILRPDGSTLFSCDLMLNHLIGHISEAELREGEMGIFRFPSYERGKVLLAIISYRQTSSKASRAVQPVPVTSVAFVPHQD